MKSIVLFGAGHIGKIAYRMFRGQDREVQCFVDNDAGKWGKTLCGVKIKSWDEAWPDLGDAEIVLSCNSRAQQEMAEQLRRAGIFDFQNFDERNYFQLERVVSYACREDMEDVILYHVLHEEKDIFYIDVGCNDPCAGSVTKFLYDSKGAHGINIDPQHYIIDLMDKDRVRDINLCLALGRLPGRMTFFVQGGGLGGMTTTVRENVHEIGCDCFETEVSTLGEICRKYVSDEQTISFLKIDVEGMERDVLLGADFRRYRPLIVVMEAMRPGTSLPVYEEWEEVLFSFGYHLAYSHGANRYYVADEARRLDSRFWPWEKILATYCIFCAVLEVDCHA